MAFKVHGIVGYASDPQVAEQIHQLSHNGSLEVLLIDQQDVARHRLRAVTDKGTECLIAIPREQRLSDGAILRLDEHCAIVVRLQEEHWLCLEPVDLSSAMELGYFCGNLHWRIRFEPGKLFVALEGPKEDYLDRLDSFFGKGQVRVIENG
jgi:urease accessory protein|tara:strand:+ start:496 stop:948 length:453 start_codon:yes stop_codon:yes gene_type:complete